MFSNIGKKIKVLASVICWIGIIASIITAIIFFANALDGWNEEFFIMMGLLTLIVGPLLSWIGSFFTYGFGELVDKTCDIEKKLAPPVRRAPEQEEAAVYPPVPPYQGTTPTNTAAPSAPANGRPLPDKIYQLQSLLTQNLITEEEYAAALERYHSGGNI